MVQSEYLKSYEERITKQLTNLAHKVGDAPEGILEVEELTQKWNEVSPEYMMEAVRQFNEYPVAVLAWPAYLGMAFAKIWDEDGDRIYDKMLYSDIESAEGWDSMDEYISETILDLTLESKEERAIAEMLLTLAKDANSTMRREVTEPGTSEAFYMLAYTIRAMFNVGVSIELHRLGYKYEKVEVMLPPVVS